MPTGESAGSIYITVDADGSPLIRELQKTESASASAAQSIARNLNIVRETADGVTVKFGQTEEAARSLAVAEDSAAKASAEAAAAVKAVGAAAEHTVPQISAMSGAVRVLSGEQSIRAIERFGVSLGLGGAAVAAFPLIGLLAIGELVSRVAGHFDKLSESEKQFSEESKKATEEAKRQSEAFDRLEVSRAKIELGGIAATGVSDFFAGTKAAENQAALTEQTAHLEQMTTQLTAAKKEAASLGLVAGAAFSYANKIDAQTDAIKAQKLVVNGLADSVREYDLAQKPLLDAQLAQQKAANAGGLQGAQLSNQGAALTGEVARAAAIRSIQEGQIHASKQADIDAMADRQAAAIASAAEEVRVAKQKESDITADQAAELPKRIAIIQAEGQAKKLGKDPDEFAIISAETAGKVAEAQRKADQDILNSHAQTIAAENRLDESRATYAREQIDNIAKYDLKVQEGIEHDTEELTRAMAENVRKADEARTRSANLSQRTGQLQVQRTGVTAESDNEVAKLQAQQAYALQIVHTKQQELEYAAQMAAFDERALQLKIATAEQELFQAVAEQNLIPTREGSLKIEEDSLKIEQAKAALAKQQIEDQTKIIELKQKTSIEDQLQVELTQQIEGIAKSVGDALAAGIAGPHKKKTSIGQDIGNDIVKALKSTGQHALGDIFTAAIKGAFQASGASAAAAKLGGLIFGSPAHAGPNGPVAASGGLLGALSGALHIPGLGGAANAAPQAAATAAQTAAIAANTAALAANTVALGGEVAASAAGGAAGLAGGAGGALSTILPILKTFIPFLASGGPINKDGLIYAHSGEHVLNEDQVLGNSPMPNIPALAGRGIGSTSFSNAMSVNSASNSFSVGAIHLHGVRDMQDVARRLPNVLKAASSRFQPASS